MRLIKILALITLLSLPVLAVEPVYLGGSFGRQMLNISANTNQGLGMLGNHPLSANYYPYQGIAFHLNKLYPEIAPYYGGWIPYTLFDSSNINNPYYGGYPHNFTLPLSTFNKLYPGIAPYYGGWIPFTLFDTR